MTAPEPYEPAVWDAEYDEFRRQMEIRLGALRKLTDADRYTLLRLLVMEPFCGTQMDSYAAIFLARCELGPERPGVLIDMLREIGPL